MKKSFLLLLAMYMSSFAYLPDIPVAGSWASKCGPISYDSATTTLTADCREGYNVSQITSIVVNGCSGQKRVMNRYGNLMCENGDLPDIGGSWINSCAFAKYDPVSTKFEALCRDGKDDTPASILVNTCTSGSVRNDHGNLRCEGGSHGDMIAGSWKDSCNFLSYDPTSTTLTATCTYKDTNKTTSIVVNGCGGQKQVINRNGNLMCDAEDSPYVGGSWIRSCVYAKYDPVSTKLEALCGDGNGDNPSSILVNSCSSNRVGNDNGNLRCN